jgi:hypothetical protein
MCRRVTCSVCSKPTYAGCGAHVEQVLAGIAQEQRCQGREGAPPAGCKATQTGRSPRKWWPFG